MQRRPCDSVSYLPQQGARHKSASKSYLHGEIPMLQTSTIPSSQSFIPTLAINDTLWSGKATTVKKILHSNTAQKFSNK
eukprot:537784-Amphidinium_carterae.1